MNKASFLSCDKLLTKNYIEIINHRHHLLINLIAKVKEMEIPPLILELLNDYLQIDILTHFVVKDDYISSVSSIKNLTNKINELEDEIGELKEQLNLVLNQTA